MYVWVFMPIFPSALTPLHFKALSYFLVSIYKSVVPFSGKARAGFQHLRKWIGLDQGFEANVVCLLY